MQFFFDILLARLNLVAIILLSGIYILRKLTQENLNGTRTLLAKCNQILRWYHKKLGMLAIALGLAHGLLSSDDVLSFNIGTFTWGILILLALSWLYRKCLKSKGWMYYHRILGVILVGSIVIHITDVGGFTSDMFMISEKQQNLDESDGNKVIPKPDSGPERSAAKFKDGTYTGKATGYRPGLVVEVTISNGKISKVNVIAHNERDPKHYSLGMLKVPEEIVKQQSADVDGISGATKTSNGIKNAVKDALSKAASQ